MQGIIEGFRAVAYDQPTGVEPEPEDGGSVPRGNASISFPVPGNPGIDMTDQQFGGNDGCGRGAEFADVNVTEFPHGRADREEGHN